MAPLQGRVPVFNFTRAARRLHIAQSGLSVSVRSLERPLGVLLFERTSHAVELTDAGTVLLDYAQATRQMVREATAPAEEVAGGRFAQRVGRTAGPAPLRTD